MVYGSLDARRRVDREEERLSFYRLVERMRLLDELDRRVSEPERAEAISLSEQAREEIDERRPMEALDMVVTAFRLSLECL